MPEETFLAESKEEASGNRAWMNEKEFILIKDLSQLKSVIDEAVKTKLCSLDLETTGLNSKVYDGVCCGKIVGFSFSYDGVKGYYAPINHIKDNLPEKETIEEIKRLCDNCVLIFHNSKFDIEFLWTVGINIEKSNQFEDTQILVYLDNDDEAKLKGKDLKGVAERYLDMKMVEFDDLFPKTKGKKDSAAYRMDKLHPEEVVKYAASDAIVTYLLFQKLKHNIPEQAVIYKIDKALVYPLRIMERNRVKIDTTLLKKLQTEISAEILLIEEKVFKLVGYTFSFTARRELGAALFEKLAIQGGKKTKSGQWATGEDDIAELADKHPIIKEVIRHGKLDTLLRRYVTSLIEGVDHLSEAKFQFDACRVPGGRFACPGGDKEQGFTGVNVQSTPKKREEGMPDVRQAFVARDDFEIVDIDYGGQELRIAANLSKEDNLFKIFKSPNPKERKPHKKLAQDVFNTKEPTDIQYAIAKSVNFQTLYGGSGKSIARNIGIAETEGMRIQKRFFELNPKIKVWVEHQKAFVRKHGFIKTYFGRIRRIPLAFSDRKELVAYSERLAINAPIQGTAGDIMRLAIINITSMLKKRGWLDDCHLLLTVHDELVFEVRKTKLNEITQELIKIMSSIGGKDWEVELEVEAETGHSWSCDKEFKLTEEQQTKMLEESKKEKEQQAQESAKQSLPKEEPKPAIESKPDSESKSTEELNASEELKPSEELKSSENNPSVDEKIESAEWTSTEQKPSSVQTLSKKVIKEPEPDDKNSYKYVVSDPLLRCKVIELSEIIKKCPGEKRIVLVDERNTSLLPKNFVVKVDPEKFHDLASARGV